MALQGRMQRIFNFRGCIAPTLTPYTSDGQVNPSAVEGLVKNLKANQVDGAYISGTTGDGLSLSYEDNVKLAKSWMEARNKYYPELLAIINVSSTCVHDSKKLAALAESLGADGIACLPPVYYKPRTATELVTYLKTVADSAPNTPFLYYHIPSFTEQHVDIQSNVRESLQQIKTFTGMKYSAGDMVAYSYLYQEFGNRVKVICGFDELLLGAAATAGCDAGICAAFNLKGYAEAYKMLLKYIHDEGNVVKARAQQDKITKICGELKKGNFFAELRKRFNEENKGLVDIGPPRLPIL